MGISPITNLMPLAASRTLPPTLDPLPMERVETSPRSGDETYSPSWGKSPRHSKSGDSEEPDEPQAMPDELPTESEFESEPCILISFFA